jgi:adenylyltransferase/sulfurtransferase
MATIRIPTPLRPYAGGQATVSVGGANVGAALHDLTRQHPDLRPHLFENDRLRSFVNVYLNREDVRYLDGEATTIKEDDTLVIVPSIAGGQGA